MIYNYKKIKKNINKYDYISFDIFDTLIKRNLSTPTNIFDLVEKLYNEISDIKIKNFKICRINAEKKAINSAYNNEPNIDEIYQNLDLNKNKFNVKKLKEIETNLEVLLCQKNISFYPIYKFAKDNNKKIIITSDMYLKKETIEQILKNADIEYDYLFLSNEVKLNKRRGGIYKFILKELNIKPNQLLHIGDSLKSDYIMPKLFRINSLHIKKDINKLKYYKKFKINSLNDDIIVNKINNNISYDKDIYYQIGYEVLGCLLLGYSKWLKDSLSDKNISKIFFLAREGALLKKAFDLINNSDIETKYLYVSRRSTRVTLLKNVKDLNDALKFCKIRKSIDLESFFINLGLNISNYDNLLKKYNCNKEENINNIADLEKLFSEIKSDVIKNAIEEEKNLILYLKQEGFSGNIAISDIGWAGSMQYFLTNLSSQNNLCNYIEGFYVGQMASAIKYLKLGNIQNGYLFNHKSNELEIRGFLGLFEILFSSDHGTTIKYEKNKKNIEPVLEKVEYTPEELSIIQSIQNGALDFIKNIKKLNLDLEVTSELAGYGIKKLGLIPTLKDIKTFENITYLDSKKYKLITCEHKIFYYIVHPRKFYNDFMKSNWKIGFLKKVFVFPLPYYKLLKILYSKTSSDN